MTPRDQVLKVWPDAVCEIQFSPNKFYAITYNNTYLGTGNTEESAWQNAANRLNQKEHE